MIMPVTMPGRRHISLQQLFCRFYLPPCHVCMPATISCFHVMFACLPPGFINSCIQHCMSATMSCLHVMFACLPQCHVCMSCLHVSHHVCVSVAMSCLHACHHLCYNIASAIALAPRQATVPRNFIPPRGTPSLRQMQRRGSPATTARPDS